MNFDSIILTILHLSIIYGAIFALGWNQIGKKIPIKNGLIGLFLTNAFILPILFLTGFSLNDFIHKYSTRFTESVQNWYSFAIPLSIIVLFCLGIFLFNQFGDLYRKPNRHYFLILSLFALIAIGLWLPFGFDIVGQQETWTIKAYLKLGSLNDNITDLMFTRLSVRLPHTFAHWIDNHGFVGYNILHCGFIFLKGALLFGILKHLKLPDSKSFVIATVFMIYPSDTLVMSMRNFTIISGVVAYLLATYAFLEYIKSPSRLKLFLYFVFIFVNVTIHEYEFLLILLFPVVLFFFVERRLSTRLINITIIWYLVPSWYVFYFISTWLYSANTAYGTDYLQTSSPLMVELYKTVDTIIHTFHTLLVQNWILISKYLNTNFIALILVASALVSVGLYRLLKREKNTLSSNSDIVKIFVLGLGITLASAFFFGVIPGRRESDWHIYSIGSIGTSIMLGTIIISAPRIISYRFFRHISVILFMIIFVVSYQITLSKHQEFVELSYAKQTFLKFAEHVESKDPDSVWIYLTDIPDSELRDTLDTFSTPRFRLNGINLSLIKGKVRRSYICKLETDEPQFECHADSENLRIMLWSLNLKYKNIVFFWIERDGSTRLLETFPYEYFELDTPVESYKPLELIQIK